MYRDKKRNKPFIFFVYSSIMYWKEKEQHGLFLVLKVAKGVRYHFYCMISFNPFYFFLFSCIDCFMTLEYVTHDKSNLFARIKAVLKEFGSPSCDPQNSHRLLWSWSKHYDHLTNLFLVVIQNKVLEYAVHTYIIGKPIRINNAYVFLLILRPITFINQHGVNTC